MVYNKGNIREVINMTYEQVKKDEAVRVYISQADASMEALGFTEHSFAHVGRVASIAGNILQTLGYPQRTVELAQIAGYLHDIGNLVNRTDHSQSGAVMAFRILDRMNFPPEEIAAIVTASVALLMMNFSRSGRTVDESRSWLKRIIITWVILNGLGFIMAYVTPFFAGGQWTPTTTP